MRRLVSLALDQPLFMMLLTILFIGAGVQAFRSLPVEAFPDVTDVQVTVITLVPGHAPEEVEKQVTIPLEIGLSGLPHSVRMFSHTQFGLSYIILTFDDQVNDYFARQQVLERLQNADLPDGVKPALGALASPVGEIFRFYLKSDTLSPTELRGIEDVWQRRRLPGRSGSIGAQDVTVGRAGTELRQRHERGGVKRRVAIRDGFVDLLLVDRRDGIAVGELRADEGSEAVGG